MFNKDKMLLKGSAPKYLPYPRYMNNDFDIRNARQKYRNNKVIAYYLIIIALVAVIIVCSVVLLFGRFNGKTSVIDSLYSEISELINDISFQYDTNEKNNYKDIFGVLIPSQNTVNNSNGQDDKTENAIKPVVTPDMLYRFDYTNVPVGETPIIPMDLSLSSYGDTYINNATGLTPNVDELLRKDLKNNANIEYLSSSNAPTVLIIHTHGTESYSKSGAISYGDNGGDLARSENTEENVVAVGKILSDELNKLGIRTLHCEIMHDKDQYRSSYERSEETIRYYLKKYPTIKLVIDLHRDSIINSEGEIIRPVALADGTPTAQVMCVVGSSWGGEANNKWEDNLALALQLRQNLNEKNNNICRPPYLKASTYNQEIAPYSLLLEIGACGNSLEEACNAARLIAVSLAELL